MLVGIGIDIVELHRIKVAVERGDRLAARILTDEEFSLYHTFPLHKKVEFLGGRFAAKEAVSKAFGTGIGEKLNFKQIEVMPNTLGAPTMRINSPFLDTEGLYIHLSISHSKENAIAQVVLERESRS